MLSKRQTEELAIGVPCPVNERLMKVEIESRVELHHREGLVGSTQVEQGSDFDDVLAADGDDERDDESIVGTVEKGNGYLMVGENQVTVKDKMLLPIGIFLSHSAVLAL